VTYKTVETLNLKNGKKVRILYKRRRVEVLIEDKYKTLGDED